MTGTSKRRGRSRGRVVGRGRVLRGSAAAVLATYLAVALATTSLSRHRVQPLFEGVGPAAPYQWVNPPPAFASGNAKPKAGSTDLALTGPQQPQFASSPDGQCLLNFSAPALPRHGSDTKVHATFTPLDPATLGALPVGEVADGNAYRVELAYQPSGAPLTRVASDVNVIVTAPHQPNALYYSSDGRSWAPIPFQPFGDPTQIGATFKMPGWFLAAAGPSSNSASPAGGKSAAGTGLVAAAVVVAAVFLGLLALWLVTRRRRDPA